MTRRGIQYSNKKRSDGNLALADTLGNCRRVINAARSVVEHAIDGRADLVPGDICRRLFIIGWADEYRYRSGQPAPAHKLEF